MKKTITTIFAIGLLVFVATGFACSFTTASMGDLKFGKNDKAEPAATSFNAGEPIYAVVQVSNAPSKTKLAFKVTYENVAGKTKGEELGPIKPNDVEGSMILWQSFTAQSPGEYRVEATLTDDTGKKVDSKTGTVKVTGGAAPTAPAATDDKKKDEDEDQ